MTETPQLTSWQPRSSQGTCQPGASTASKRSSLSAERLRELLIYDPHTGVWTWRVSQGTAYKGMIIRSKSTHGYIHVKIDRVMHDVHRLAFLYTTYSINNSNRTPKYGKLEAA